MNDTELDDLLDRWTAPAPSASLRAGVQAGFAGTRAVSPQRRSWSHLLPRFRIARLAAVLAGTLVLLIGATQALPQAMLLWPLMRIPYRVETEFDSYSAGGALERSWSSVSYIDRAGREIVLSSTGHHRHWTAPLLQSAQIIATVLSELMQPVMQNGGHSAQYDALVRGGCVSNPGAVVGHETVVGYLATVESVQSAVNPSLQQRVSFWRAPALGCFPLRMMVEQVRPDGSSRLRVLRQAIRVEQAR